MIKKSILFIIIITMISCNTRTVAPDYFGQPLPNATPVIFAKGTISKKGRFEHGISFTPDIGELTFGVLDHRGLSGKIYYTKKVNDIWTTPEIFVPLENENVFLPYFTPNGTSLLYAQRISDLENSYITDIWSLKKVNGDWNSPKKMQSPINSESREANASMTNDGTIYFSSNRNCEGKEKCYTADLFYSKLVDNTYKKAQPISQVNSSNDEESIFISPKEDYIIFCRYSNNESFVDLHISYRDKNNIWTIPQILDDSINSKDWDRRPFVSMDNKFLFFTRLEIGEKGLTESDIYWVNTSKVFKPFVYNQINDITLNLGEQFETPIPTDYFKDIDGAELTISIDQNAHNWLDFDNKNMKLSGLPTVAGKFKLAFTAMDALSNITKDTIQITVNN